MGSLSHDPPEITKVVRKEGPYARKPSLGGTCLVKLQLTGDVAKEGLQSDYLSADTVEFEMGNGDWPVDKAIESCVETMRPHEESSFTVKFGSTLTLNLDITLESVTNKEYIFNWSDEDKLEACKRYKANGIELFNGNRIDHAFFKFSKALKMLLMMDKDVGDAKNHPEENEILVSLYNNISSCQFHLQNYEHAIKLSGNSLEVKPNVKGYFRRALAYIELQSYEKAQEDLIELLKIEPKNKAALEKYKLARSLDKDDRESYEAMVRRMFT